MNARQMLAKLDGYGGIIPFNSEELEVTLRALRLLAAAEANDGSTPETDDAWTIEYASDNFGEAINQAAAALTNREQISGRLERERNGLAARVAELERAVDLAARAMAGEGVEDQGQAWDRCLRILDAARSQP